MGSSQTSSVGSETIARAIDTRCCWPPDSSVGLWLARSARPTSSSAMAARFLRSRRRELGQQQRQFDVALRRQHRHQVVELEHEADLRGAPLGERAGAELVDALAAHRDAAAGGRVEAADQVEQASSCRSPTAPSARGTRPARRRGRCGAAPRPSACRARRSSRRRGSRSSLVISLSLLQVVRSAVARQCVLDPRRAVLQRRPAATAPRGRRRKRRRESACSAPTSGAPA